MKLNKIILLVVLFLLTFSATFASQNNLNNSTILSNFYKKYLSNNYLKMMPFDVRTAKYFQQINEKLKLTSNHIKTFNKNGFIILDNAYSGTFANMYLYIYGNHLPVFITTDSILNAFHHSYDKTLKHIEENIIINQLNIMFKIILEQLSVRTRSQTAFWKSAPIKLAIQDVTVFINVANALLNDGYPSELGERYYNAIKSRNLYHNFLIFGEKRSFDASMFIPRGHYTESEELKRYFEAMSWLSRIYLKLDNAHQIRMSLILSYFIKRYCLEQWNKINQIFSLLVGQSDNANVIDIVKLMNNYKFSSIGDTNYLSSIMRKIKENNFGIQKIIGVATEDLPSAYRDMKKTPVFNFIGQRYTIDSEILSNTTIRNIRHLPRAEDVAFALGSNIAAEVLKNQLKHCGVTLIKKLESARELMKKMPASLYEKTVYHSVLKTLSTLFNRTSRDNIPSLMKTRAWNYLKLNTMLGSYAELKHDNILYSKPAYLGGSCEFPAGYIEPNVDFFRQMIKNAGSLENLMINIENSQLEKFWKSFKRIMIVLNKLVKKQLQRIPFNYDDNYFIKSTMAHYFAFNGCGSTFDAYTGWYFCLLLDVEDAIKFKPIIADIANNGFIRKALYIGTGKVHLGVFAINCNNKTTLYLGPVYSSYQFTHPLTNRITDEIWETQMLETKSRVKWVKYFSMGNEQVELNHNRITANVPIGDRDPGLDMERQYKLTIKMSEMASNELSRIIGSTISRVIKKKEKNLITPMFLSSSQDDLFSTDPITMDRYYHSSFCLFDNDVRTSWVTNRNRGIGAYVNIVFKKTKSIYDVVIKPGYDYVDTRFGDLFMRNTRPKKIKITLYKDLRGNRIYERIVNFSGMRGDVHIYIPNVIARAMKLKILSVYIGTKYPNDMCINEMKIYGRD